MTGSRLPDIPVVGVTTGKASPSFYEMLPPDQCSLLVVMTTRCQFCRFMRRDWTQRARAWADSVGVPLQAAWIGGEQEEVLAAFYDGFDFDGVELLRAYPSTGMARRLGIFGTPTTYLLDPGGALVQGVIGDRLPAVEVGRLSCL